MASKISIRIPTLNNHKSLVIALESIYEQDYKDSDVSVVDNDSDDGSWPLTQELPNRFPRLQVLQNPKRGLAENWNFCAQSAIGKYVLIFHTDDIMLPDMLRKTVDFLDEHATVGMVHGNCIDVTETGKETLRITQNKPILRMGDEALMKIALDCNIACSTVVVRKECYEKLGVFMTGNPSPDPEMWARIVTKYDMGHINEPLVKMTAHIDSYGRVVLSKLPPAEIEKQWRVVGDKINSYFSYKEKPTIIEKSRISGFNALSSAAYLAWCQKRWIRGHQFMALAAGYSSFHKCLLRYGINLSKSFKYILINSHEQH
jgi:glycosyltransferase involved in cell wall biosynthesis